MAFTLAPLPYAFDALEPHIDARTMEIHHTKHHQTYVDKLNAALQGHDQFSGHTAEQLIAKPELLAKADLDTLRKLFTAHSRNESLNDGHMAEMIDEGHLKLAVKRLTELL